MNLLIEQRKIHKHKTLARDLSQHLAEGQLTGTTIIVTDDPEQLLQKVQKRWDLLVRRIGRTKYNTLSPRSISLRQKTKRMKAAQFKLGLHKSTAEFNVSFVEPSSIDKIKTLSQTVYITCPIQSSESVILHCLLPDAKVVIYNDVMLPLLEK